MNGPNILTGLRILMIPALIVVLLSGHSHKAIIGFAIFMAAAITDMLDGIWARKKGQITVFGELLDPTADKLLIASAFICLVELGVVPAWIVIIIIGREIAVSGFRAIASSKGINIPASIFGKIKMNAETYTVALLILGEGILGKLYVFSQIGLWISIVTAVISAAEIYIKFGKKVLSN